MFPYKRAGVDDGPPRVGLGSRVVVELIDERGQVEQLSVAVVPNDRADLAAGYLGVGTPLAGAILGRQIGDTVPYNRGDLVAIRIVELEPFAVSEAPDAATARRAVIDNAIAQSDLQDTLRLALTVDVKWGEYDPDGLGGSRMAQEAGQKPEAHDGPGTVGSNLESEEECNANFENANGH